MDGWMDGRGAALNAAPYGGSRNKTVDIT